MGAIDLIEPPQQVLGSSIDVITTRIIWEVFAQWRTTKLLPEQVDFVEEQNNTRPHEPSRINDRVKKNETLHHPILREA